MSSDAYSLDRSLIIRAPREVVFRFFTDSERFARWWGSGSSIDCRPGGEVRIVYPNAVVAGGTVESVQPDKRLVFSYGYENALNEVPIGGSRVTIELEDHSEGTLLHLHHELPSQATRDHHEPGWRFQLSLFANVVANEQFAHAAITLDEWFAAWAATDVAERTRLLATCATEGVTLHDAYACLNGRDDLSSHIAMTHIHMPGTRMTRVGEPRQSQGTALVDWVATDAEGAPRGRGTNVVTFAPDGRIASVTGFWG